MIQRALVTGKDLFFAREGTAFTVPSAGTVSRTAKPGAADSAWGDLGPIAEGKIQTDVQERDVRRRGRLVDVLEHGHDTKITGTLEEFGPQASQLLFRHLAGVSTGQFNPLESRKAIKGWLKCQIYDEDDTSIITVEVYVRIKLTGAVDFDGQGPRPPFEARVLHSLLNTGLMA